MQQLLKNSNESVEERTQRLIAITIKLDNIIAKYTQARKRKTNEDQRNNS